MRSIPIYVLGSFLVLTFCALLITGKNAEQRKHVFNAEELVMEESEVHCSFEVKRGEPTIFTRVSSDVGNTINALRMPEEFCVTTTGAAIESSFTDSTAFCMDICVSGRGLLKSTLHSSEFNIHLEKLECLGSEGYSPEERNAIKRICLKYLNDVNFSRNNLLEEYDNVKESLKRYADVVTIWNYDREI